MRHLADYLRMLSTNDTAYMKYFEWTKYYQRVEIDETKIAYCNLCRLLYEHDHSTNIYNDIEMWWRGSRDSPYCIEYASGWLTLIVTSVIMIVIICFYFIYRRLMTLKCSGEVVANHHIASNTSLVG